jgi:hypothetical protein
MHTFANKAMAGDLAVFTDKSPFLYLHKSPYFRTIINTTTIGVDKIEDLHIFANFYIIETLLV